MERKEIDLSEVVSAQFLGDPSVEDELPCVKRWFFDVPAEVRQDMAFTLGAFMAQGLYNGLPIYKHEAHDIIVCACFPEHQWLMLYNGEVVAWVDYFHGDEYPSRTGWRIPIMFDDDVVMGARWRPALASELDRASHPAGAKHAVAAPTSTPSAANSPPPAAAEPTPAPSAAPPLTPRPPASVPPPKLLAAAAKIPPPPPPAPWKRKVLHRGGWFNKCQEMCAAVLDGDEQSAKKLARKHWAKKAEH